MNYSYRLHPQAREDLANAYVWYEEAQTGLGERFVKTVKDKIDSILLSPGLYGSKKKGFRETIISKDFPFLVVYKIVESKKEILISSIFHAKRNPKNKYRKL
jgi:plasmid stabilization system protein ParE